MSSKLKKALIAVAVFLVVGIGALLSITMLSNLSSTTVFDLRLIDAESSEKIFDKEVYLTSEESNNFTVMVNASASSPINYVVSSSDPTVASVSKNKNIYTISYHKVGETRILASCADGGDITDSFTLSVKEYIPTSFTIKDAVMNEIELFADAREYSFDFLAKCGSIEENINLSSLIVEDNYNSEVFEDISIDSETSKLIIKAKQSEKNIREYITVKAIYKDSLGKDITINNFVVCVNVKGNYLKNLQLIISKDPNFESEIKYIYGDGEINEALGEKKIDNVFLSDKVEQIFVKARVVFTNGEVIDIVDIANKVTVTSINNSNTNTDKIGQYFVLSFSDENVNNVEEWTFVAGDSKTNINGEVKLRVDYIADPDGDAFQEKLYRKDAQTGFYKYVYWDTRYERDDAITDKDGNIIGFVNWNPLQNTEPEGE